MKALILAAGLGTRLRPHTLHTPKALFSINNRPAVDLVIEKLVAAGCRQIGVNTHYLHEQISSHLARHPFADRLVVRHEPDILGTGGAIRNFADLWDDAPFMVINADIVTDIDLGAVFAAHRRGGQPATMVLHDRAEFNVVRVTGRRVIGFEPGPGKRPGPDQSSILAFTGIQVIDRRILDYLPADGFASVIDAYDRMLSNGRTIVAHIVKGHYWQDIGTADRYSEAVLHQMAPVSFKTAFRHWTPAPIDTTKLAGDGSDRRWYRLSSSGRHLVAADHGIRSPGDGQQQVDAFLAIGRHLEAVGVPVPHIVSADRFAGLVIMEDVGSRHLQDVAAACRNRDQRLRIYRHVIEQALDMALAAKKNFDPQWTYQTPRYDRSVIVDSECHYFLNAFIDGYLGLDVDHRDLQDEFELLAERILTNAVSGFLHRDLQSRNIMVHRDGYVFIDFQGGRIGPLQYDLAALLIDPYVALDTDLQDDLQQFACNQLARRMAIDPVRFHRGFDYCAIARNLQMLGAFGFLAKEKKMARFAAYMPRALYTLNQRLASLTDPAMPRLKAVAETAAKRLGTIEPHIEP